VVADVRQTGLAADPRPAVFVPHGQAPTGAVTLTVRATGDPAAALGAVKHAVWALNPSLAVYDATTLDALVADQVRERQFYLRLLGGFAAAALALAGVGVYGALSHAVGARRRELGVRLALGAQARDVARLVLRQGLAPAVAGAAGGVLVGAALSRLLRGLLFETPPLDGATFATATVLILLVAGVACAVPARRAGRADPMTVLRAD
jgi:putative ABC transport system permease protein